jgi:tetratricopeptide (TPR) repeat protein
MNIRFDWLCALALCLLAPCGGCATATASPATPAAQTSDNAASLFRLGLDQARRGDTLRAEQYFLAAQRAGQPAAEVLPRLLEVCVSSDRLRSALGYAEPYLRAHPEDFRLRHLVGSIHFGLGDAARAYRELQAVLSDAPSYAPSHYLLAVIADESFADLEDARRHFQGYLALEPHGPHAAEASSWLRDHPGKKLHGTKGRS